MNPTRPILVVAVLAIAQVAASAAAHAADDPFLPLGPGARWVFEIHRDHTFQPAVGTIDRTFRSGTAVLEHVRAFEADGGTVHELRERRDETSIGSGLPPSSEAATQHWAATSGLQLRAIQPLGGARVRFDPPLQMLPSQPVIGSGWRVGTFRTAAITIPLEGEVLGWEDLTDDAIRYEKCLKVRYTGAVSGSIAVASGSAKIRNIRFERVVWWKPGVGLVREIVTTDGDIELPEGEGARVHEVTTLRLVRHTAPR